MIRLNSALSSRWQLRQIRFSLPGGREDGERACAPSGTRRGRVPYARKPWEDVCEHLLLIFFFVSIYTRSLVLLGRKHVATSASVGERGRGRGRGRESLSLSLSLSAPHGQHRQRVGGRGRISSKCFGREGFTRSRSRMASGGRRRRYRRSDRALRRSSLHSYAQPRTHGARHTHACGVLGKPRVNAHILILRVNHKPKTITDRLRGQGGAGLWPTSWPPQEKVLFGHLFFNITNVFCAKKRVGHACICPRMVTG